MLLAVPIASITYRSFNPSHTLHIHFGWRKIFFLFNFQQWISFRDGEHTISSPQNLVVNSKSVNLWMQAKFPARKNSPEKWRWNTKACLPASEQKKVEKKDSHTDNRQRHHRRQFLQWEEVSKLPLFYLMHIHQRSKTSLKIGLLRFLNIQNLSSFRWLQSQVFLIFVSVTCFPKREVPRDAKGTQRILKKR